MSDCQLRMPVHGFAPQAIGSHVENKYLCSHCRYILRNPVQSFCGHRYCRTCVEQILCDTTSVKCEPCMQEGNDEEEITMENVFPDNATKRELNALPASCPNNGCPWTGTMKLLEKHESECELRLEECKCGIVLPPEEMEGHWHTTCPHRSVSCPHCAKSMQLSRLQEHDAECPNAPVSCPKCGEEAILRKELTAHKETPTCKPRVRCPYGCGAMVEEAHVDVHVQSQVCVHLDAMNVKVQNLTARLDRQSGDMQETLSALSLGAGAQAANPDGEVSMETEGNTDLVARIDALDQKMLVSESFSIVLKREVEKVNRARMAHQERIEALEQQMARLLNSAQQLAPAETPHEPPAAECQLVPSPTNGNLLWKIANFLAKKREAASGGTVMLTSQPFYTSPTGYKLCARIYPNGDGVGKTNYISVFIVVMRGQYDNLLKWPFRQKIIMTLQDQGLPQKDIVDIFRPDPASASFQRPTSEFNTASGCPMFAKQSTIGQIGENQYIKDGTLILKITVDSPRL